MLYANSVRVSGFNNVYKYTRKASLPDHIRPERSEDLLKEYPDLTPGERETEASTSINSTRPGIIVRSIPLHATGDLQYRLSHCTFSY